MAIDWSPLAEIVSTHRRFVLSSHVRPDGDAIGSELGLAGILESQGKTVRIVNPSHTPHHLQFLDPEGRILKLGKGIAADEVLDTDVHIVVDTSAWAQLLEVGEVFKRTRAVRVVIDHHQSADDLGAIEFKDPSAEATGSLIVQFAEAIGATLDERSASALFCAMATDTGWFRFPTTSGATLRRAGRLIDCGAKPHLLYQQLYERLTPARVRLFGRVLSRLQVDCEGRLAYVSARLSDFQKTQAAMSDTEELVNECLRIVGVQCAFLAVEQPDGRVKVSLRSRTDVDVAAIAETFGGGGHRQAAGAMLSGPIDEAVNRLRDAFREALCR